MTGFQALPTSSRRQFRPKWWAILLALLFVAVTILLGNWQGERAQYKLAQQAQLDAALSAAPLSMAELTRTADAGHVLRYRKVNATGSFVKDGLFYVDNRIHDGAAGYVALQLFQISSTNDATQRYVLVDRGWVAAPAARENLPALMTPDQTIAIEARVNLPLSRNPGTFDNVPGSRLNYINIDELARQTNKRLEPYVLELTGGIGFTGAGNPPPSSSFEKNRAYQVQWYAFAALAGVLFFVLSFSKQEVS